MTILPTIKHRNRAYFDKLTAWIADHPGMLHGQNDNGTPIIKVDAVDVVSGERWVELSSVWTLKGARYVLGY